MANYAYLMLVDGSAGNNNNKFYEMIENEGAGTFTVKYGREGAAKPQTKNYPIREWSSKHREKIKKGYTDVTDFKSVKKALTEATAPGVISNNQQVATLIEMLQKFAKGITQANYKVEARDVTQAQIDAAQASLDKLGNLLNHFYGKKEWDVNVFNAELQKLFTIIPRKMKRVSDHLLSETKSETKEQIQKLIQDEQTNIDAMASQVTSNNAVDDNNDDNNNVQQKTLLESLGLKIDVVKDIAVINEVKKLAEEHGRRVLNVYSVVNETTQKMFDAHLNKCSNKLTKLLWHGSRVANWFSILQQGLKIRPSNAVYTGSMFGDGIYYALQADKSMGYTDSGRWVQNGQNVSRVFMALYEVHLGNYKEINSHDSNCYQLHKTIPNSQYDSAWAKKGRSLFRDEIIIYNSNQNTIKYLVEFSN